MSIGPVTALQQSNALRAGVPASHPVSDSQSVQTLNARD